MLSYLSKLQPFPLRRRATVGVRLAFDQADPECQKMLLGNNKLVVAINYLCEHIKSYPQVSGVRLAHVVDAETEWEQIFVRANTDLPMEEAMKLEDEIVESISEAHWLLLKDVAIVVEQRHGD